MSPGDDERTIRKASLRRLVLTRRSKIPAAERDAAANEVAARVSALDEVSRAKNVLGFASFGTELPTDAVMAAILTAGKRLLLPYVDGEHLRAAEVRSVEDLAPGYRGIREPVARVPVDLAEAGVVLVPGVAFDERGNRLGYGGGFYDGLLSEITTRIPRIGVCFDLQVVDDVPAADHDQPVDLVVTERRLIRCLEA
ncbi:MAG TPA: 5-formyltetrahydrofolate cyclo-ligase [Actinomycetota bacterium]|nr:5-formyltetrahydrofolate cyclo-ligase [Actinomycetota bacterium]